MTSEFEDSADLLRHCFSANCLRSIENNTEGSRYILAAPNKHLIFHQDNVEDKHAN